MNKTIKIIISILVSTIIFAAIGFFGGTLYGGNYGCFTFIDSLFSPLRGYESCGYFGFWTGVIIGIAIGVLTGLKSKIIK